MIQKDSYPRLKKKKNKGKIGGKKPGIYHLLAFDLDDTFSGV